MKFDVIYDEARYAKALRSMSTPHTLHIPDPLPDEPSLPERTRAALKGWDDKLTPLFAAIFPYLPSVSLKVRVTQIGPGGSYHLVSDWPEQTDGVTVREDRLFDANGGIRLAILIHEIIHLCIEPELRRKGRDPKYDPEREWLVDEIMQCDDFIDFCQGHKHQCGNSTPPEGLKTISLKKELSWSNRDAALRRSSVSPSNQ